VDSRYEEGAWLKIQTNRKLSAQRQIHAALGHFNAGDYECAITLSLAAEDQMPEPEGIYMWVALKQVIPDKADLAILNETRNWLKHFKETDTREISEFEVAIALLRATSKYHAVFGEKSPEIDSFVNWCLSKDLLRVPSET
jgi:hypothetical protein